MDTMGMLCHLCHASDMWRGKTLALKVALIEATENWEKLTGGGPPCPDICETMKLDAEQRGVDKTLEFKEDTLKEGQEQAQIVVHCPLDDIDEKNPSRCTYDHQPLAYPKYSCGQANLTK
ncbi:hypothetical protein EDC04DRAFT_2737309 [Pisolithus marmoratus]|nr:hypothetical protein EDC04DRAFT_2737309 [Pisolithus marmoratus]